MHATHAPLTFHAPSPRQVFIAVLLGRLRPVAAFLSWRGWAPIACLSFSAYLLQARLGPCVVAATWTGPARLLGQWAA